MNHDFGVINTSSTSQQNFTVTNTGGGFLHITSVTLPDAEYTITPSDASIASEGNFQFTITFAPATIGSHNGNLTFTSQLGNHSNSITGFGVPLLGAGTEINPFQISSLNELAYLSQNSILWNKHFIQTADIDASPTSGWNPGFAPIGNETLSFSGLYNGQNHTIDNLYINGVSDSPGGTGLFGITNMATIKNIGVRNITIQGYYNAGGLVGNNYSTVISNAYSSGDINGHENIGGLVGNNSGTIEKSYSSASLMGNSKTGGLTGFNQGTIQNSYARGQVNSNQNGGGLAGHNEGTISKSYSTGSVSCSNDGGGLVGLNYSTVSNSFWDTQTSNKSQSDGGTGKTTAEMKNQNTFLNAGWDWSIWNIGDGINDGYPYIRIIIVNDAPVLSAIEGAALGYLESSGEVQITNTITVNDANDVNLESAVVQITGNYNNGEDVLSFINQNGISGSWNTSTGTMTLSGSATLENYQTALRSITYNNTSSNPNTSSRTVSFTVNDGDANSNTLTREINITAVNNAPVLSAIEGAALAYIVSSGEVQITNTITVSDADDTNLESAVVQITGNYQSAEDELTFVNQNGITGNWNATTGTMTLSGSATLVNYQTALRSIKYNNTIANPNTAVRTVSFTVNDGNANSNTVTRNITLNRISNSPYVTVNTGANVIEGGMFIFNDTMLESKDDDGPSYSLIYEITQAPQHGTLQLGQTTLKKDDVTNSTFTQNDIANRKVKYIHNGGEAPADTFKFVVKDGDGFTSDEGIFVIAVTGVNDPPVFTGVPVIVMNEDEECTLSKNTLLDYVFDPDDADSLLTITLSSHCENINLSESGNSFHADCTENWFGTGELTLSVSDRKANIDTIINITVQSINDLPVLSGLPSSIEFIQTSSATVDLTGTAIDVESPDSLLVFSFSADPDSINVSYNNQTGIATITSAGNFTGNATLTVTVTDADGGIVSGTTNVTVTPEVVGIEQLSGIPEQYSLYQNYPNPFNPTTKIKFGLPEASQVSLKIYDMLGREIAILANSILPTGYYEYNWNATDNASGIYFCVLSTSSNNSASAGYREIRKMLLIK